MNPRLILCLSAIVSTVGSSYAQGIVLKWKPKAGDKTIYKTKMVIESDLVDHLEMIGTFTEVTVSVDAVRAVTKTMGSLTARDPTSGEATEVPTKPDTTITRLDGTVLEVDEKGDAPQGQAYRIARMTSLMLPNAPVSIGGKWSTVAHVDKEGIPDLKVEYTLAGEERVGHWDTYRITDKGGEVGNGGSQVEATFWVDKVTGVRIRTQSRVVGKGDRRSGAETIETDVVRQR